MFISFEGTEGVGKTTLIRKIYEHLEQQGILFELELDLDRRPEYKQKPVDTAQKEIHRHAIQPISISNQQPITRRRLSLD